MPNPQEILDFARTLSESGIEDLQLQLFSRQSNKRKELLQVLDELLDAHANSEVIALLRSARVIEAAPAPLKLSATRRNRAG